jgi:hypothetical protein
MDAIDADDSGVARRWVSEPCDPDLKPKVPRRHRSEWECVKYDASEGKVWVGEREVCACAADQYVFEQLKPNLTMRNQDKVTNADHEYLKAHNSWLVSMKRYNTNVVELAKNHTEQVKALELALDTLNKQIEKQEEAKSSRQAKAIIKVLVRQKLGLEYQIEIEKRKRIVELEHHTRPYMMLGIMLYMAMHSIDQDAVEIKDGNLIIGETVVPLEEVIDAMVSMASLAFMQDVNVPFVNQNPLLTNNFTNKAPIQVHYENFCCAVYDTFKCPGIDPTRARQKLETTVLTDATPTLNESEGEAKTKEANAE